MFERVSFALAFGAVLVALTPAGAIESATFNRSYVSAPQLVTPSGAYHLHRCFKATNRRQREKGIRFWTGKCSY
jgi:hypothetical protein